MILLALEPAQPDALAVAPSVLFQHPRAKRRGLQEPLAQLLLVVVRERVRQTAGYVAYPHERVLRAHRFLHRGGIPHELPFRYEPVHQRVEVVLRAVPHARARQLSRVDPHDERVVRAQRSRHLVNARRVVLYHVARRARVHDAVAHADRVVSTAALVLVRVVLTPAGRAEPDVRDAVSRIRGRRQEVVASRPRRGRRHLSRRDRCHRPSGRACRDEVCVDRMSVSRRRSRRLEETSADWTLCNKKVCDRLQLYR
eukprot:31482-Pelagococcus_subviridis.AAC.8